MGHRRIQWRKRTERASAIVYKRCFRGLRIVNSLNRATLQWEARFFAMFHLDYLSCFLTVLATMLLARKSWIGLIIASVNSLIVCAIALRTLQLGFIPANLFCICIYAFNIRSWLKEQTHTDRDQAQPQDIDSVADEPRMSQSDDLIRATPRSADRLAPLIGRPYHGHKNKQQSRITCEESNVA
jgi:hypothetical protein